METLRSELRNFKLHFSIIFIPRVEMTWLLLGPISNNMQYDTLHNCSLPVTHAKKKWVHQLACKKACTLSDMHADWIMQKSKTLQSTNFIKIGLPLSRDWGKSFTREQSINKGTNLLV